MSVCRSVVAVAVAWALTAAGGVFAETIWVPDDYETIQGAIDAAVDGDEIAVRPAPIRAWSHWRQRGLPGAYHETIDLLGKAIRLYAVGHAPEVVIDATGLNASAVKCVNGEGADTVIEGFTIIGGSGTWREQPEPGYYGGGMLNVGGSPTVRDCSFINNGRADSEYVGGGMCNLSANPTVIACLFDSNWADDGGGMLNYGSAATVSGCTFSGNDGGGMTNRDSYPAIIDCTFIANCDGGMHNVDSAPTVIECAFNENGDVYTGCYGSGMHNRDSYPTVIRCVFQDNIDRGMANSESGPLVTGCVFVGNGGGMYNQVVSSPVVTDCSFAQNVAWYGGGMYNEYDSNPIVTNCTFEENQAVQGGGMDNVQSSPAVVDCTFVANTAAVDGGGLRNENSNATITNCVFRGNRAEYGRAGSGGGGMANLDSNPMIVDCVFDGNTTSNRYNDRGGGGILNENSSPTVMSCTFEVNAAKSGGGIYNTLNSDPVITDCEFRMNAATYGAGMFCERECAPRVSACAFIGNNASCGGGGIWGGAGWISGSAFCENTPNHLAGEWVDAGRNTMCPLCDESAGDVLEVPGEYPTIQGAIEAACDGAEVIVSAGTYYEEPLNFGGKAIAVRSSDGPALTVIDSQGTGPGVLLVNFEGSDSILEGFTFQNAGESGLRCRESSPLVEDCVFRSNSAVDGGAVYSRNSSPTLTNCKFIDNEAGRYGGGIYSWLSSSPTLTNCTFVRNTADEGGAMHSRSDRALVVANCTFVENTANVGGALYNNDSGPTVSNSIIWDNTSPAIRGTGRVSYSDVQGGWPGMGNIDADPLCDADGRPQAGSPCIDAGVNNAVPADTFDLDADGDTAERIPIDLDGDPRFADDLDQDETGCGLPVVVDMGAFEYQGVPIETVIVGDVDGNGVIDVADLLDVLAAWGACDPECCLADVDFSWRVDFADLLLVLGNWG